MKNVLMVFALLCSMVASVNAQQPTAQQAATAISQANAEYSAAVSEYNFAYGLWQAITVQGAMGSNDYPWNHNPWQDWADFMDEVNAGNGEMAGGDQKMDAGDLQMNQAIYYISAAQTAYNQGNYYSAILNANIGKGAAGIAKLDFIYAGPKYENAEEHYDAARALLQAAY